MGQLPSVLRRALREGLAFFLTFGGIALVFAKWFDPTLVGVAAASVIFALVRGLTFYRQNAAPPQ